MHSTSDLDLAPRPIAHPLLHRRAHPLLNGSVVLAALLGGCTSDPTPLERTAAPALDVLKRPLGSAAGVFTQHADSARSGLYASETQLTWADVPTDFGKLFTVPLDGRVFAQPLFAPGIVTFSGTHDLAVVATENNTVYGVDAQNGAIVWSRNLGTPIPSLDAYPSQCLNIPGTIGITGTPVIDAASNTIYVVNATKASDGTYHQFLNALDLATGAHHANSPHPINAQYPGDGPAAVNGQIPFDALRENQRPGLLLLNGKVYVGWAGHCDDAIDGVATPPKPQIFFGWLMSFDASSLALVNVFNTAPHADPGNAQEPYGGSVWHGAGGLASDGTNIYVNTGNALFDPAHGDWGDSTLTFNQSLGLIDSFTPSDQASLDRSDLDFSAGGVVILPPTTVPQHPNALVTTGKEGTLFMLDRNSLGGTQPAANSPGIDRICPANQAATGCVVAKKFQAVGTQNVDGAFFGLPALFNNQLYFAGNGDRMRAFSVGGTAGLTTTGLTTSTIFQYPGSTPSISASGISNGIVWALERTQPGPFMFPDPTHLHAYRADTLAELYNSSTHGEDPANAGQFIAPTVANGKVFIGTSGSLAVYGLFVTAAPASQSVVQGSATTFAVGNAVSGSSVTLSASGLPAGASASFSPATVASGGASTLTITTALTTPVGTYPIIIAGASGSVSHSTAVTLVVTKHDGPPTAAFTFSCTGRLCTLDGTSSFDAEGPIAGYGWSLGDGTSAIGGTVKHLFPSSASYVVALTVSDSAGQTSTIMHTVSVTDAPPTAAFIFGCTVWQCQFDGTGSHDVEGPIAAWSWSFGDGTAAVSGARPVHNYTANGTYTVTLTVTDSVGQTAQVTHAVAAIDQPPRADFWIVCTGLTCYPDAEPSSDDVAVVSYAWTWGDGSATSGGSPAEEPSHSYAAGGTYTITLTVSDTLGQTNSKSRSVSILAAPVASFIFSCSGRECSFDGSASTGPAPLVDYRWYWGDESATQSGVTAIHDFPLDGPYQVELLVTDSNGEQASMTQTVNVP